MTKKSARPSSTVIGYLRVSTADQNIEKNKADIFQLANHHDLCRVSFVEEKISGKVSWRQRKIAEVLELLQANDAIIVSELSRLGRSMLECMEILSVAAQKRITIFSIKGNWRLDQSIQSKIIAMAFSPLPIPPNTSGVHVWLILMKLGPALPSGNRRYHGSAEATYPERN